MTQSLERKRIKNEISRLNRYDERDIPRLDLYRRDLDIGERKVEAYLKIAAALERP